MRQQRIKFFFRTSFQAWPLDVSITLGTRLRGYRGQMFQTHLGGVALAGSSDQHLDSKQSHNYREFLPKIRVGAAGGRRQQSTRRWQRCPARASRAVWWGASLCSAPALALPQPVLRVLAAVSIRAISDKANNEHR